MKNAMKRIMSILLVALLLVSALPLAASADVLGSSTNSVAKNGVLGGSFDTKEVVEEKQEEPVKSKSTFDQNLVDVPSPLSSFEDDTDTTVKSFRVMVKVGDDVKHDGTLTFDDEKSMTAENILNEHFKSTYATAKLSSVAIAKSGEASQDIDVATPIFPGNLRDGEYIVIRLTAVLPVYVKVVYNGNDLGTISVNVPNKESITFNELVAVAKNHSKYKNWNLDFDGVIPTINGNIINTRDCAYPNETVVLTLVGGNGTAGGILGGLPVSGGSSSDNVGGGSGSGSGSEIDGTVRVIVYQNNSKIRDKEFDIYESGATVYEALTSGFGLNADLYDHSTVDGVSSTLNTRFYAGSVVKIYLTKNNDVNGSNDPDDYYRLYDVILHVYIGDDKNMTWDRDITLNEKAPALLGSSLDKDEVEDYLITLYKAKSAKGIRFLGLYESNGIWEADMFNMVDAVDSIDNLVARRGQGPVHVNIMLQNAVRKTSSSGTADTSNPKTGDTIFAPIAVLGVSATALAAVMYFYNKKRIAR